MGVVHIIKVSIFWIGFGFAVGSVLGSFIKVLADRSLTKKSFRGRSYCTLCRHTLAWYDLLPIFSYLILKGNCRYCRKKISKEYLIVEVAVGLLIGFLFWQNFPGVLSVFSGKGQIIQLSIINYQLSVNFPLSVLILDLLFKTFFITILAALFITDIKKMFIPDRITYPAIFITFIYLVLITGCKIWFLYFYLSQSKIGQLLLPPHSDYFQRHAILTAYPLLTGLAMALLIGGFFTMLIVITRGRGMGGGDVKLGAFIGLVLGFPNSLIALMLSFFSGAIVSLGLLALRKKHFGQTIPFGPFLVFGSLVALFWGKEIMDWYLHLSI